MGRFAADPDLNKDLTGILLNLVWIPSHYMTSFANIVIFRLCILNNKLIIIRLSNMLYLNMNFIFIDRGLWGCGAVCCVNLIPLIRGPWWKLGARMDPIRDIKSSWHPPTWHLELVVILIATGDHNWILCPLTADINDNMLNLKV